MNLIVFNRAATDPSTFVDYWSSVYSYRLEHLYEENIGTELTVARLKELFKWKNGLELSGRKGESVRRNCLLRLDELKALPSRTSADGFLEKFANGGAIWRIFFLHCWAPKRFPIFDQHVYRAMRFIQSEVVEEIPNNNRAKVGIYLDQYLAFFQPFGAVDLRLADRALWAFGKFIKNYSKLVEATGKVTVVSPDQVITAS